jgi:hypothetical protein
LKCIFDIFENIKKVKIKIVFCKFLKNVFCKCLCSTCLQSCFIKTDFLYDLCKNVKIWY